MTPIEQQQDNLTQVDAEAENITFEEFLVRYAEVHAEWVGGKVEIVVSNNIPHQRILGFLYRLLSIFLDLHPVGELLLAGVPMKLATKEGRGREPDLLIVLNENRDLIKETYLDGPADIAIEIVSPDSVERDYGTKFEEYEAGGVREYWRIDPLRKIVDLHSLGDDRVYHRIEFDAAGRMVSLLLPGFALDPEILWRDQRPGAAEMIELVQAMTKKD